MSRGQHEVGSGAVSLGLMVVIHEAASHADARRAAARLEEAGIPALVQSETDGLPNIPTPTASHPGAAFIVVPSLMQEQARGLLDHGAPPKGRKTRSLPTPSAWSVPPPQPGFREILALSRREELDDAPLEAPLPDTGPLTPRLWMVFAAIAFGALMQQVLSWTSSLEVVMSIVSATRMHADQWWRVVTAGFFHFGFAHHFSNAVFAMLVGTVLVGTHRAGATFATWLLASMAGMTAQMLVDTDGALIAGASAGNYGLVGLWVHGQLQRSQASLLPRRERLKTLGIVAMLIPGALTPITASGSRVAVMAHAMGFVVGFLAGYVFFRRIHPSTLDAIDRRSRVGLVVSVSLVGAAFAMAVAQVHSAGA